MSDVKKILDACKSPYPIDDSWLRKFCKRNIKDSKQALLTYCYIRESIKAMNDLRLYNFIPDVSKTDIVKVMASHIVTSELITRAWEK